MRISDWSSDVCSSDRRLSPAACAAAAGKFLPGGRVAPDENRGNPRISRLARRSQPASRHRRPSVQDCRMVPSTNNPGPSLARAIAGRVVRLALGLAVAAASVAPVQAQSRIKDIADFERSEEHTSELQSLMRISYAVFCLKKKNISKVKLLLEKSH